jgi:hypothetical protein
MCDFSEDLTTEDIVRRRICAIDRMVALCSQREVPWPKQRLPTFCQDLIKEESPEPESPDPELFPLVCQKTQCPICIGDEHLTYSSRTFCYKRPSHMMDHVERAHLQKMPSSQQIICHHPMCKAEGLVFNSVMHFKNHVAIVHGISLRPWVFPANLFILLLVSSGFQNYRIISFLFISHSHFCTWYTEPS